MDLVVGVVVLTGSSLFTREGNSIYIAVAGGSEFVESAETELSSDEVPKSRLAYGDTVGTDSESRKSAPRI